MNTERIEINTEWGDFGVEPNPNNTGFRVYEKDKENSNLHHWICTVIDNGNSLTFSAMTTTGFILRNFVPNNILRLTNGKYPPLTIPGQLSIKTPHSRDLFARKVKTKDSEAQTVIIGYSDGEHLRDALWCTWKDNNLDFEFAHNCTD